VPSILVGGTSSCSNCDLDITGLGAHDKSHGEGESDDASGDGAVDSAQDSAREGALDPALDEAGDDGADVEIECDDWREVLVNMSLVSLR